MPKELRAKREIVPTRTGATWVSLRLWLFVSSCISIGAAVGSVTLLLPFSTSVVLALAVLGVAVVVSVSTGSVLADFVFSLPEGADATTALAVSVLVEVEGAKLDVSVIVEADEAAVVAVLLSKRHTLLQSLQGKFLDPV